MNRGIFLGAVCLVGILTGRAAWADGVVLVNGDTLHGDVVSLDGEALRLESNTLGELTLKRQDVASIHFGDVRLDRTAAGGHLQQDTPAESRDPAAAPTAQPGQTPEELIGQITGKKLPRTTSDRPAAEDALRQLQSGGLNTQALSEVQKALPLLNTPEVQEYFNNTVGGLMGGSLSIQDVRKDAVKARDMILDLKKDLGPGADALNGYLSILEGFIQETEAPAGEAAAGAADEAPTPNNGGR